MSATTKDAVAQITREPTFDNTIANTGNIHLVDAEVIANQYGLKPSYVYKMAREGRIPVVKIGRLVRFDVAEVESFFKNLCSTCK